MSPTTINWVNGLSSSCVPEYTIVPMAASTVIPQMDTGGLIQPIQLLADMLYILGLVMFVPSVVICEVMVMLGAVYVSNYNQLNEWPFQFLRTGYYYRSYGNLLVRTTNSYWWSSTVSSVTLGRGLNSWADYVNAQSNNVRGSGFALREVRRIIFIVHTLVVFEIFAIY